MRRIQRRRPGEHVMLESAQNRGVSRTGSTGCSSCGGGGNISLPGQNRIDGKIGGGFSVPSFNVHNLNVTLPILPVYYNSGKGPSFQPALIYHSQGSADDGFGPKWHFVYQDARYRYSGDTTLYVTMLAGDEIQFNLVNGTWVVQDGYNLTLTVLGNGDIEVVEPDTATTYVYNAGGMRLVTVTDVWGQSLNILRSSAARVTKVTTADARESTFDYDGSNRCTKITSATGDVATFLYDTTGAFTQVTDMGEGTSSYYYDANCYLTRRTTALGSDTFTFTLPTETSNAYRVLYNSRFGRSRNLFWNASDGADTLVQVTKGSYGTESAKVTTQGIAYWVPGGSGQTAATAVSVFDRDATGYVTRVGRRYGDATYYYTLYYRDGRHNITKVTHPDATEQTYGYDSSNRMTTYGTALGTTIYYRGSNGVITKTVAPDSNYVEYYYATDGVLTKYRDDLGNDTVFGYDGYSYLTKASYAGVQDLKYEVTLAGLVTKYTDPLDNATTYLYDGYLRATKATFPDSTYTARTFNCCNLTAVRDGNGAVTNYYYDSDGTITKVTDPLSHNTLVYYDDAYHLTKFTDALGNSTTYSYDTTLAKMTKITYPDASSTAYFYESGVGMLTKTTSVTGASYSFYYGYGTRLTKVNDGRTDTVYAYGSVNGLMTKATSAGSGDSLIYYDSHGAVTKQTDPRGQEYTFSYNSIGLMTRASGPISRGNAFYYDGFGRMTQVIGGEQVGATYYYDLLDRITEIRSPEGASLRASYDRVGWQTKLTDALGHETVYEVDSNGAVTRATDPTGLPLTYLRDSEGQVTAVRNQLSQGITLLYDAAGNVTCLTDANSKTATQYYSSMGLVTKSVNGNGYESTYSYAPGSMLTKAARANGKATCFAYNQWGGLTKWRQYLQSGDPSAYDLWDHQLRFYTDTHGRNTKREDYYETGSYDNGQWTGHVRLTRATIYSYDSGSLITKVDFPNIPDVSYSYNDVGQVTKLWDASSSISCAYDNAGRATKIGYIYDSGALTKAFSYSYDRSSRLTGTVDGEGTSILYARDPVGGLTGVTEGGSQSATYLIDAAGKTTRLVYGNNAYTDYFYDSVGAMTLLSNRKSDGTMISSFTYYLDPMGVRTRMDIGGSAYAPASIAYDYDNAYELTKETRTGGSAYTQSYWYDNAGNRTKSQLGAVTTNYCYDYIDRLTLAGSTGYSWDEWGNVTKVGANDCYFWDDANRLTKYDGYGSANDTTYGYAPGSWNRIKRIRAGSTTRFGWDKASLRSEYLDDGTLSQSFLTAGLDSQISTTTESGTYYYFHDGLGSVRNLINVSETVMNTYDTRAFGQDQGTQTLDAVNPFRYMGAYYDSWEGPLYYMRNRYYMPAAGLFASRDVMWADAHKGWGYVYSNPVTFGDSFGLSPDSPAYPASIPEATGVPGTRCPRFDPDDCDRMAKNVLDRYRAAGNTIAVASAAAALFKAACEGKPKGQCPPGFRSWKGWEAMGYTGPEDCMAAFQSDFDQSMEGWWGAAIGDYGRMAGMAVTAISAGGVAVKVAKAVGRAAARTAAAAAEECLQIISCGAVGEAEVGTVAAGTAAAGGGITVATIALPAVSVAVGIGGGYKMGLNRAENRRKQELCNQDMGKCIPSGAPNQGLMPRQTADQFRQ